MLLSGIRRKQKAKAFLSLDLIALFTLVILFSIDAFSASAMRSRVYGFRNTDNKEAMQLVGKLGFKVTIDAHSSTVVVLTGDDADELTRAYTLMEVTDQKEPVVLKVLGLIPDDRAEAVIEDLHNQLKTLNIGTLLNPPAKAVADPLVIDIYQGELIAVAAESQIGKIERAYQSLQSQKPQTAISEPNVPALAPAVSPVPVEPNKIETPIVTAEPLVAVEPNIAETLPEALPKQIKPAVVEPNKPVFPETSVVQPAETSVAARKTEPNQAGPQESGAQEDFISSELLKTLDVEEKKVEAQKAAMAKPQPVETKEASASEPAKEISGDEFKKIIAQLMKQAAEEEKKTAARKAPDANASEPNVKQSEQIAAQEPAVKPEEQKDKQAAAEAPAEEGRQSEKEAVKPVVSKSKSKMEKTARTETAPKTTKGKTPPAADLKDKSAETEPSISKEEEELEVTMTLPEKVEIKQLIELVGKQLGLNYVYDETKITGTVTLKIHDGKIKVKDCYALLETVLRYRNFVMTRRGNLVTIVPSTEIASSDPKIHMPDQPIEPGDIIVNGVFPLKYVSTTNAQNMLSSLLLGTKFISVAETNTLIVTDYSYRMAKIEEILKFLDVQGKPKLFANRKLEYMQAAILIPRLQTLASQLENLSITVGTSATPAQAQGMPPRYDPRTGQPIPAVPMPSPVPQVPSGPGPLQQTVYLDADERTNRILMVGTEEQLKTVNELIDTLDVRQHFLRFVKEYEIKNVDASEVINVLNELGLATVSITTKSSDQTSRQGVSQPRPGMPATAPRPATPQAQPASGQASTTIDQPSISIRPNTNSLLVNATIEQHEDIELVIKHIDVEQKDQRTIEEYEIQNVDAKEVVQTLGDLSIISKDSVSNITTSKSSMYDSQMSSRSGRSSRYGSQQQSPFPQQGIPGGEGAPEPSAMVSLPMAEGGTVRELITTEPQISILETTNSLLIYATPRQHASVALVIAHVDRELSETTAPYVVYPLENQDPEELADTLSSLIEGTVKQKRTTSATGQTQQPGGMGPMPMDNRIRTEQTESNLPKKDEERITIIPDVKSYSIIVYANKKNQQWIASLIKQLDQYRPQVLLDCTLVEITKDDQFTMDLNVISKKYGLTTPFKQLNNPITGNKTVTNTGGTALEGTFDSTADTPFSAFYGDNNIQVLLEMMDKKNYGRVLARPSVLVKDNEEGIIKSENVTYVAELTSNTINNGDTAPTTTENVTFKDYTAGITLTITPHISSEKIMQLEIELDRTDFLAGPTTTTIGTTTYPKPLNTTSSNVKTWSIVPSGATIILGGIETVDQSKTNTKVPLLGDIPIVGLLFRGINQTDAQSKLYIFVKANIVKPGDELTGESDIERISRKKRQAFEEDEARFQGLDSVPGLKPNPLYPDKILEDDEYIHRLKEQQIQGNAVMVPLK